MKNYQTIFWSLRFHGNLFFKSLYVEVKRIWQKNDDTICLRWTVHGLPRLPWDQEGTFDGVSTYKLDSHGKVWRLLATLNAPGQFHVCLTTSTPRDCMQQTQTSCDDLGHSNQVQNKMR